MGHPRGARSVGRKEAPSEMGACEATLEQNELWRDVSMGACEATLEQNELWRDVSSEVARCDCTGGRVSISEKRKASTTTTCPSATFPFKRLFR